MHIIARMNVGGPAVEIVELMRGLDPQIVSQRLVTGNCDENEADYLETQAPDIQATRIEGLGRSIRPTDDAKAFAQLVKLIRSSRPDIVHTHTAKAGVLGRLAAKLSGTGTSVIHTYHGHLLYGYFGPAKTKAWIQTEKKLARVTDRLVTVGDKVQQELLQAGIGKPAQYRTIRSGVRLKDLPTKAAAREMLGLNQDTPVVSMIARLTQVKRPDRFLEVAELVINQGVKATFLIAGGGDLHKEIETEIQQRNLPVRMLGWRSDPETVLAATDILLIPSDNEGVPLVALEALNVGTQILATNVGSLPEVLLDGAAGVLTEPKVDELAAALLEMLRQDSAQFRQDGNSGRSSVPTSSMSSFIASHEQVYLRAARH